MKNKNLNDIVQALQEDCPNDNDAIFVVKVWSLVAPHRIRRGGNLFTFRQHIIETLAKRQVVKPENFNDNEWLMYKSQTQVWQNMLDEFDRTLTDGGYAIWLEEVNKLQPVSLVDLPFLFELPPAETVLKLRKRLINKAKKK